MGKHFWLSGFLLALPIQAVAAPPQGFSGDVGLGASSSTGTSQALSLNTEDALYWVGGPWSNQTHLSYNYARSDSEVSADRLALRNDTHYLFDRNTYALGDVDYIRNHFDGYYYRVNLLAGLGHYFYPRKDMRLSVEAAVGGRQAHLIGETPRFLPVVRVGAKYRWQISKEARLREEVQAILVDDGANTYQSRLAVDTPLVGSLGMRFSFLASYNAQVRPGFKPFNTLTAVNLVYHFGDTQSKET
ncbi:MAG: DUF481 domain-containing protein [Acidithiobacillus sp.]|nr:DUF481 domain-containing protein [Acidithiobacillus sp.]